MPLINLSLEQDDPLWKRGNPNQVITDPEKRRKGWNTERVTYEKVPDDLSNRISDFLDKFIKPGFIDLETQAPVPELILMFTVNKKILMEILEQDDCEGIRMFLSSSKTDNGSIKTNVDLRPVNGLLEELEVVNLGGNVKVCNTLTECPPTPVPCPKTKMDDFLNLLKFQLNSQQ